MLVPALLGIVVGCTPQLSTTASYTGDFPDPAVIRTGALYYAFATQAAGGHPAVQRLVSTDHQHWQPTAERDALAALPSWADDGGTWAPSIDYIRGRYVLYYTVHQRGGNECLSIATAASPAAPFVDASGGPIVCAPRGETIDPAAFRSPDGTRYLLWKGPDADGVATLYAQVMSADGLNLVAGTRHTQLKAKRGDWTAWNIEGPSMVLSLGTYYLFYSGGNYWTTSYAMGYARCKTPLGPCTNMSAKKPWLATHGQSKGPGGGSVFADATGEHFLAYHAWGSKVGYSNGGIRQLWVDGLRIVNGVPQVG